MPTLESHTPCHLPLLGGSYPDVIPDPGAGGGSETEFTSSGYYSKKKLHSFIWMIMSTQFLFAYRPVDLMSIRVMGNLSSSTLYFIICVIIVV